MAPLIIRDVARSVSTRTTEQKITDAMQAAAGNAHLVHLQQKNGVFVCFGTS